MWIYIIFVLVLFLGDNWIKNQVESKVSFNSEKKLLGGLIRIRKHHNKGAILNFMDKKSAVVAVISLAMTLFCIGLFVVSLGNKGNTLLRIGMTLLLGGAFSNTYDRLKRKYVVDYFSIHLGKSKFSDIIFNLSDFGIIIGTLFLVFSCIGDEFHV